MIKIYDFEDLEENKTESGGKAVDVFGMDNDGLLVYYVINSSHSLKRLLMDYGTDFSRSNIYCPFHEDEMTGKQSAKYHDSDDSIYCFSEQRKYTAYHALKILYGVDVRREFYRIWSDMSDSDRETFIRKYSSNSNLSYIPETWKRSVVIVRMFRKGKVNFRQHKNALHKISTMIYGERFGGE